MLRISSLLLVILATAGVCTAQEKNEQLGRIETAMRKAATYFDQQVSAHGGYLWRYSDDLSKREGEGSATRDTVWVQPPGTPSVGQVFLDAFKATGDRLYLDAALRTGKCLAQGQLRSGGWDYRIEFDPKQRRRYAYRVDGRQPKARNTTTLDDNTTQAALRFLMRLDGTLEFKNEAIHECATYALNALLAAQYPNGAWPQRFDKLPDAEEFPVKKAGYPESWSRTYPGKDYREYYTFNDNAIADTIDVMFLAERIYGERKYRLAATRAGEFILTAQMPEPQPAWAQQYNLDMQPAWARKFEPPAITGGESQGVMRTLMQVYRETGERRFLEPVPRAIKYLRSVQLDDGRLARFYELRTNKPLYFTRKYELTYRDDDLPTHYGFKVSSKLDGIERDYKSLASLTPDELARLRRPSGTSKLSRSLEQRALSIAKQLDEQGRWTETGQMRTYGSDDAKETVIECRTFIRNMEALISFVRAARANRS